MKKGQGLSLNTIIIAAIVLIVLVVLWAIFTGRMGAFSRGLDQAQKNCKDQCEAAGYPNGEPKDECTDVEYKLNAIVVGGKDQWCCCATA